MTIAAKDILNKMDEVYALAEKMEDFFYEHTVITKTTRDYALDDIYKTCTYLENKLLLRFAQGYARLEQREGNK